MPKISELEAIDPATIDGNEMVPVVKGGILKRSMIAHLIGDQVDLAAQAATTATTAAGTSTTQAGVATEQATTATTQAAISTTQAATSTTQAGIATAAANQAQQSANDIELFKYGVDMASTRDVVALSGVQDLDGVTGAVGKAVLLAYQADRTKNGIYTMAAGAWARRIDADTADKISSLSVLVKDGARHGGRLFRCVSSIATLGTDPVIIRPETGGDVASVQTIANQMFGVYVINGDSNAVGSITTHPAFQRGRGNPNNGAWKHWTKYAMADSGMKLHAIIASIATGNRAIAPQNYKPNQAPGYGTSEGAGGGGGSIWMVVNALKQHTNALLESTLGINDFGLSTAGHTRPDVSAVPATFRENLEQYIALILAETTAHIVLRIPQPFSGEADFITSSINTTDWVYDSPDGTIATNAARYSQMMIDEYRRWVGRNPRVTVVDMPRLVYGADRCDNSATDCLSLRIGATFRGIAVPTSLRRQIDNSLHASTLGKVNEELVMMEVLGLAPAARKPDDHFIIDKGVPWSSVQEWFVIAFESLTDLGVNTLMKVRLSPETLHWRGPLNARTMAQSGITATTPAAQAFDLAEKRALNGGVNPITRVLGWRNAIKIYFPLTGNTYTATDVVQSGNVVVDGDTLSSEYLNLQFNGADFAAELALHQGPDLGYPGTVMLDQSRQLAVIYIDSADSAADQRWSIPITVVGTLGSSPSIFTDMAGQYRLARTFRCTRTDNVPPTHVITLSLANQGDGRLIDGTINFGTGEGMPIGTFTFSSGVRDGTWVPNTANIDAAIAAGIGWQGTAGSNIVTLKHGYHLRAKADIALGNPACVVISN